MLTDSQKETQRTRNFTILSNVCVPQSGKELGDEEQKTSENINHYESVIQGEMVHTYIWTINRNP